MAVHTGLNINSISGQSLTGSASGSLLNMAGTWNTSGTPTAIKLNITNTASNAASKLLDLQVGGTSKFGVRVDGSLNRAGTSATTFLSPNAGSDGTSMYMAGAGNATTAAVNCIGIGYNALASHTTGNQNIAIGTGALQLGVGNIDCVAIGYLAGNSTTGRVGCTYVGTYCGFANTTGDNNTSIGDSSQHFGTTGSSNASVGYSALYHNISGSYNSALGQGAGYACRMNKFRSGLADRARSRIPGPPAATRRFGRAPVTAQHPPTACLVRGHVSPTRRPAPASGPSALRSDIARNPATSIRHQLCHIHRLASTTR